MLPPSGGHFCAHALDLDHSPFSLSLQRIHPYFHQNPITPLMMLCLFIPTTVYQLAIPGLFSVMK